MFRYHNAEQVVHHLEHHGVTQGSGVAAADKTPDAEEPDEPPPLPPPSADPAGSTGVAGAASSGS
eukprot:6280663-Prorocentrum_lima.AAC.1